MTGQPQSYNTALYLRLSRDDGIEGDSSSIQTQRDMLTRYCKENGFTNLTEYVDDGFSGTTSNRPAFQRMLSDIEDGKINCVMTKDLSRLGRNYLETGGFTEIFFPEHNVRYIALTDGVDTANGSAMDITPFKNLLNDMYSQDLSKKIRSAKLSRQKQGKFIGPRAPYGYIKDPDDKNHLIIDERYAPIVRRIYRMAMDGLGMRRIAEVLREEKIPRPAFREDGVMNGEADDEKAYMWNNSGVRQILENSVYKGANAGQKTQKLSLKSKKIKHNHGGEFVVENCHEPIISPEEWDLVQEMIKSRKKESNADYEQYDNIFAGLVKCADCGYSLTAYRNHRKYPKDIFDAINYHCNLYRVEGKDACTQHKIGSRELYEVVLADIRRLAKAAVKNDDKLVAEIAAKLGKAEKDSVKQTERELKKAQKRLSELDKLFAKLYEEHVNGEVSERNYKSLSAAYESEQAELERKIEELTAALNESRQSDENAVNFVDMIREYADIKKLSAALLHTLVECIYVHESEEINGETFQRIDIFYKFIGNID